MGEDQKNPFSAESLTRMWSDFATRMTQLGATFTPQTTPPEAARQARTAMLRAWAEYCDQYMRSDEFLSMFKQSLDGAIQARQQLNDFLGQMHHEFQGPSRQDIDGLMQALQRLERRITDESGRIAARLDSLDQRLSALEPKARRKKEEA
jgi:hypothetical protein